MKYHLKLFAGFLLAALCMAACDSGNCKNEPKVASAGDLNRAGCVIGVPQGAAAMIAGEQFFDQAKIQYYSSLADGYTAVRQKKIDAFVFDRHTLGHVVKVNPDLALLPDDIADEHIVIGLPRKHTELLAEVNKFIAQYRQDGTYEDMYERWFSDAPPPMPDIAAPANPTRKLKIGTEGLDEPMSFYGADSNLTGFDIEFAKRLALVLNAELEITTMPFDGLIPAVESGRIDLLIASLNGTPERREKMLMSDDYVDSAVCVMIHKDDLDEGKDSENAITSVKDLKGKRAAYLTGTFFQEQTERRIDGVEYLAFNDNNSSVQALRSGKADAVILDEPVAKLFAAKFPDELQIACVYAEDFYGYAFRKGSPLAIQAGNVIKELKSSGELEKLVSKWCGRELSAKTLGDWTHKKDYTGANGTFRFAAEPVLEPMCYAGPTGDYIGLDIELARRIAYELNMKFEFIPMNFGSLIEALISGKADAVGGAMSITDERREKVDFADCYYVGGITLLVRTPRSETAAEITGLSDLNGKKIGVLAGTTMDRIIKEHFPGSSPVYFNSFTDLPVALESGKIAAFLMEEPQTRLLAKQRPNLAVLPEKLSFDEYAFIFSPEEKELCEAFSLQIRAMRADGTLDKLDAKWFSGDESLQTMPESPANPPNGILRFATVPQLEPFSFIKNARVIGYDIEVAQLAAERLGYGLEPVIMDWNGYLEAVLSGKVRFGAACTTVTEERKQKALFSEPDYHGGLAVVILKPRPAASGGGFGQWLTTGAKELSASFERTFIREDRWKLICRGLEVTILITVLAAALGTVLAFGVCAMRRAKNRWISGFGKGYVALMQGTPILVILMILYYVIFARLDIDAVIVAVIGFALNFAAYTGEMFRTGIESIPKGQSEAAMALGFSRFAAFRKVIFPQVLRRILPIYKGEFINMLKMTSIVGYIAIQDLTKMSDIIRSRTYEAFFPLIATAIIYFAAAHLLASGLSYLEFRLDPLNRRRTVKGGK